MNTTMTILTVVILIGAPLWSFRYEIEAKLRGVNVQDLLQTKIDRLEVAIKGQQHRVVGTSVWVRGKLYAMSAVTLLFVVAGAGCYFGGVHVAAKHYVGAGLGVLVAWIYAAFDIGRGVRQSRVNAKVVGVEF